MNCYNKVLTEKKKKLELDKGIRIPPFCSHRQVPRKILDQQVTFLVLVAPVWQAQPWYPSLLELCVAPPFLGPQYRGLLTRLGKVRIHPLSNLQLAGWLLSGSLTLKKEFHKGFNTSWLQHGGREPHQPFPRLGEGGVAGAVNSSCPNRGHFTLSYLRI